MEDTGVRKFGIALGLVTGAAAAGKWEYAMAAFALYTLANVVLKLAGKPPEAAE